MKGCFALLMIVAFLVGFTAYDRPEESKKEKENANVGVTLSANAGTEATESVSDAEQVATSVSARESTVKKTNSAVTSHTGGSTSITDNTITTTITVAPDVTKVTGTTSAVTVPAMTTVSTRETAHTTYTKNAETVTTCSTETKTENVDEEKERQVFCQLYANEKDLYKSRVSSEIETLSVELQKWRKAADDNTTQYYVQQRVLRERYAGMGLLNSGAYQSALASLEQNYKSSNREYMEKIQSITQQINELEKEKEDPTPIMVLIQMTTNYPITIEEAIEKYNRYIA